jgi:hypothetical protein
MIEEMRGGGGVPSRNQWQSDGERAKESKSGEQMKHRPTLMHNTRQVVNVCWKAVCLLKCTLLLSRHCDDCTTARDRRDG